MHSVIVTETFNMQMNTKKKENIAIFVFSSGAINVSIISQTVSITQKAHGGIIDSL